MVDHVLFYLAKIVIIRYKYSIWVCNNLVILKLKVYINLSIVTSNNTDLNHTTNFNLFKIINIRISKKLLMPTLNSYLQRKPFKFKNFVTDLEKCLILCSKLRFPNIKQI